MTQILTLLVAGAFSMAGVAGSATKVHAKQAQGTQENKAITAALADYVAIQEALASDSVEGAQQAASALRKQAAKVQNASLAKVMSSAAMDIETSTSLEEARAAFKDLSKPVVAWVQKSKPSGFEVGYCAMAGSKWVQKAGDVANPYMGKKMLRCGEKV